MSRDLKKFIHEIEKQVGLDEFPSKDKPTIMIIDDDKQVLESLSYVLSDFYNIILCQGGDEALNKIDDSIYAIILDIRMEKMDGFEVFKSIRQRFDDLPVIFYTGFQDIYDPLDVWNKFNPFGYVAKGSTFTVLKSTLDSAVAYREKFLENKRLFLELKELNQELEKKVQEKTRELERLVVVDELTGIYNRRYFKSRLEYLISISKRYLIPFCLTFIDLDDFKSVNDRFGHQIGDDVLKSIGSYLSSLSRETDTVARYGGEEFVFLLENTDKDSGLRFAHRIRDAVEGFEINTSKGMISLTVSIGIACSEEVQPLTLDSIIALADQRMYWAKHKGKNRVQG